MSRDQSANLLRVDLVKQHWRTYCFVCVVAVVIHLVWLAVFGVSPSTDFHVRYEPEAHQLLAAVRSVLSGGGFPFSISTYGSSRIVYTTFVALCYAWVGTSLQAVIYPQLAIVWLVYPLMFHVLLNLTRRPGLSLCAMCVWLTYYDGYQWQFWGLPDAFFRLFAVASFFVLLRLWETHRESAFVWVTALVTLFGTLLRIETPLYALPAVWLAVRILGRRHPKWLWGAAMAMAGAMWAGRALIHDIFTTFVMMQVQGWVLPGSGFNIPGLTSLAHPTGSSAGAWLGFFVHLFLARAWHAITPFPALWSTAHRLYYGLYVVAFYGLTAFGLRAALRRMDTRFLLCLWMFVAGIGLQTLVAVDPSMRYGYTPQVFLFFCASMSWPALHAWLSRQRRSASAIRQLEPL